MQNDVTDGQTGLKRRWCLPHMRERGWWWDCFICMCFRYTCTNRQLKSFKCVSFGPPIITVTHCNECVVYGEFNTPCMLRTTTAPYGRVFKKWSIAIQWYPIISIAFSFTGGNLDFTTLSHLHGVGSNQFLSVNIGVIRLLSVITTTPSNKNNVSLINTGPTFLH